MDTEDFRSMIHENRVAVAALVLVVLVIAGGTVMFFQSITMGQQSLTDAGGSGSFDGAAVETDAGSPADVPESPEFDIATGDIQVESDDAKADSQEFRGLIGNYSGEIDSEDVSETSRYITYEFEASVLSEDLEDFIQRMEEKYEVEEVSIDRETVEADREANRKKVLLEAMDVYNEMLEKVRSSEELTTEEIRVVSELTDERARVADQLNRLGYRLDELEEQEQMSQVSVTFREEVKVEIMPEDIGQEVREELSSAMDSIVENGSKLVAVPVELVSWLFIGVRYALIALVVLVPFAVLLKIGEKLWKKV